MIYTESDVSPPGCYAKLAPGKLICAIAMLAIDPKGLLAPLAMLNRFETTEGYLFASPKKKMNVVGKAPKVTD